MNETNYTTAEIAKECGVDPAVIRYWCRDHQVPKNRRNEFHIDDATKALIINDYDHGRKKRSIEKEIVAYDKAHPHATIKEISDTLGCTQATVRKYVDRSWNKKHNEINQKVHDYKDSHAKATIAEISKALGLSEITVEKHLKAGRIRFANDFMYLGLETAAEIEKATIKAIKEDRKKVEKRVIRAIHGEF